MPPNPSLLTPEQTGWDSTVHDVRERLGKYVSAVWAEYQIGVLGDKTDPVIAMIAQTVLAAQLSTASFTSAYFAQKYGRRPSPVIPADIANREGGVTKAETYARAFRQATFSREVLGKTQTEASKIGLNRLQNAVGTDLQMATIRQGRRSMKDGGAKYYRRIPTGRETCAMCLIAATQRYKVDHLLPIHPACDCREDEIEPGLDLDHVIDPKMLEDTHQQVKAFTNIADRGGRMPDYRELIITHEHGEIGPVIAWRNHEFTGPGNLNPPKKPATPAAPVSPASDAAITAITKAGGIARADTRQIRDYLTAKHGVRTEGFQDRYNVDVIRQYGRAVDDMLTKYPHVKIHTVRIGASSSPTEYAHALETNAGGEAERINLSARHANDRQGMYRSMKRDVDEGFHPPGFEREPVYSTMVHEIGHAVDYAGNREARRSAAGVVRAMYNSSGSTQDYSEWLRENLTGYSLTSAPDGRTVLNVGEALAEAFADVEINGADASPTSKALHKLLVDRSQP